MSFVHLQDTALRSLYVLSSAIKGDSRCVVNRSETEFTAHLLTEILLYSNSSVPTRQSV